MGSYYSNGKTLREYDARIVAALIVALNITDPADVLRLQAGDYYAVDTIAGELVGHFQPGFTPDLVGKLGKIGLPGAVFQRFPDPSIAKDKIAGVSGNGKHNFHFAADHAYTPEHMVWELERLEPTNLRWVDRNYGYKPWPTSEAA